MSGKKILFSLMLIFAANLSYAYALRSLSGDVVFEEDIYKNPKVVLFFWASWCPHCIHQMKNLSEHKQDLKKMGIKVYFVNAGESPAVVERVKERFNIEAPIIIDDGYFARKYNVFGIPTFICLKDGERACMSFYFDEEKMKTVFKNASGE